MMRLCGALLLASAVWGQAPAQAAGAAVVTGAAPVSRSELQTLEKRMDARIQSFNIDDPILLLGNTRAFYLEGYGTLFTCEVNLSPVMLGPFLPKLPPEARVRIHNKKTTRLPVLKQMMQELMVEYAVALDNLPAQEKIGVGVSLFHFSQEDHTGLPLQILMEAPRQVLVDFKAGRVNQAGLTQNLRVREF
jgi:hypothetical protein